MNIYIYRYIENIYCIFILLNFRLKETTPTCQPLILGARHLRDVSQLMLAFDSFPWPNDCVRVNIADYESHGDTQQSQRDVESQRDVGPKSFYL